MLLVPSRAATKDCTLSFSCSANALNPSSDFANANVSFPVVGLIFIGGVTPRPSSSAANLGLDINSSFATPASSNNVSLRKRVSVRCSCSPARSRRSVGSIYILNVRSISSNSCWGKLGSISLNISYVRSTSFIAYSANRDNSSVVKSSMCLPIVFCISVPLTPTPYLSATFFSDTL